MNISFIPKQPQTVDSETLNVSKKKVFFKKDNVKISLSITSSQMGLSNLKAN